MARRRVKKRTHVGAQNGANPTAKGKPMEKTPKSMVIRIGAGEIGPSVSQLVKDMRLVMEPGTATRLKERKSNKLRDYTTMCGPLGVTHLLLFSRSDTGNTNMRLAITPRGPTLHFRVENYSLCKDIMKAQRRPKNAKQLYMNAPLLVMNNFSTQPKDNTPPPVPKHLESLVTTIFQSLIPPLNPQNTPLGSVKRVLLLNREPPTDPANNAYTVTLRHYTISSKVTGIPKPLKRLNQAEGGEKKESRGKGLPNLGKLEDVSEYLLAGDMGDAGNYTSASESEPETDAEVEVLAQTTRKVLNRSKHQKEMAKAAASAEKGGNRPGVEKRAVKLTELGPRMRMRLIKVEEGLCGGKIMWHDHVQKSAAEQKELEKKWEQRRQEKEARRRVQKENVERKKKERGAGKEGEEEEEDEEEDGENGGDYDIDDDEYWDSDVSGEEDGAEDDEDEEMEDGG